MSVRTRFAPSPTGFLHIGNARTALYNWLFARSQGGTLVLRVEDTDAARSTSESAEIILDGIRWLGLDWDEGPEVGGDYGPYYQSERSEIYDRYFAKLEAADLVYEDEGAMRFRVPDKTITVNDQICGEVSVNLVEQGSTRYNQETKEEESANPDLVIRRPDGSYIFHFVNVVDDIEMGITHVIRGEDHLSNTPKHLALFEALGVDPPVFAHIPLNLNPNGSKMSKRDDGALIHQYRDGGFLPEAVDNYMALLGWSSKDDREIYSLKELVDAFDLGGINPSNSKFDLEKCQWVNAEHIKTLPLNQLIEFAKPFLEAAAIPSDDARVPAALELARERVQTLAEIPTIVSPIFTEDLSYDESSVAKVASRAGSAEAVKALSIAFEAAVDWNAEAIKSAIASAAESINAKMGALMFPCRVATMGSSSGADLVPVLELVGKSETLRRIAQFRSKLDS
ncbi:MAG: glutamate--tRNA ligase [Verrucomicrobiota bacterium]